MESLSDVLEIAHQLTLVFSNLYCSIQPYHLLNQDWNDASSKNPAALLFELIKQLSGWTMRQVLESTERYAKFVEMAQKLRGLNNYSGVFSTVLGLNSHVVSRLKL